MALLFPGFPGCFSAGFPVSMPSLSILDVGFTWLYYFQGSLDVIFRFPVSMPSSILDVGFTWLYYFRGLPGCYFGGSCINALIIDS